MIPERRRASSDRRSDRRAPLVAAVRSGGSLAQILDIGTGGLQLVTPSDAGLPDGEFDLEFELPSQEGAPDGEVLTVRAEVILDRACGPFRATSVRFAHLDDQARDRIAAYVDAALAS